MANTATQDLVKLGADFKGIMRDYTEGFKSQKAQIDEMAVKMKEVADRMDAFEVKMAKTGVATEATKGRISPEFKAMLDNILGKAATVANPTTGGYVAIPEFVGRIEQKLRDADPMRQFAEVINVSGNVIQLPYETDDADTHWVGELESRNTDDGGRIGMASIPVNELIAKLKISEVLLNDAAIPIESYLIDRITDKIERATGAAFVVGDGFNKPLGVFEDSGIPTMNAGSTTALSLENLYKLWGSVPEQVDNNDGAFYMNKATMAYLATLKGDDNFYWQPSVGYGIPAAFNGAPVRILSSAPNMGNAAKPIIYGSMKSCYKIVQSVNMTYQKDEYTGADDGQVYLRFKTRVGGQPVMRSSVKALVMSV